RCIPMTPEREEMEHILQECGFSDVQTENYFVRDDLQDHFLYSFRNFPERYLSEEVRRNTSAFSVFSDPEEVERGVSLLEEEIRSGKIRDVMRAYENGNGDYLFYIARKKQ
ncbi:MAG TPA: class I SAM-dependent methyltransferase, partial [Bacteroidia bacterium]|nr:class I SAM-dependent methyltransferase [Bacteroidia bacterium]